MPDYFVKSVKFLKSKVSVPHFVSRVASCQKSSASDFVPSVVRQFFLKASVADFLRSVASISKGKCMPVFVPSAAILF